MLMHEQHCQQSEVGDLKQSLLSLESCIFISGTWSGETCHSPFIALLMVEMNQLMYFQNPYNKYV